MSNDATPAFRHRGTWPQDRTHGQLFNEYEHTQFFENNSLLFHITDTKIQEFFGADLQTSITAAVYTDYQNGTSNRKRRKSKRIEHTQLAAGMAEKPATTVMIRHIGCRVMQEAAVAFLDEKGLKEKYDFVYLPMNQSKRANLGYMFVNFLEPEYVNECKQLLNGKTFGAADTLKKCEVTLAHVQGYEDITRHFRSKGVMRGRAPLFYPKNPKPQQSTN